MLVHDCISAHILTHRFVGLDMTCSPVFEQHCFLVSGVASRLSHMVEQVADKGVQGSKVTSDVEKPSVKSSWPLYILYALIAGVVGAGISWGFLSDSLAALGIPDPGRFTTAGLPFFRAASWMVVSLAVGSFLASAFLISPRLPGGDNGKILEARLTVDGHLAARTGSVALIAYALIALLMIPLTLSDVSGTPFARTLQPDMWSVAISQVSTALAWLWVALIAGVVGIAGLFSHKWSSQPLLFEGAILSVIPLGMEGHSASGGDHDYGTNSYLWHLVFLVIWVGGLMALIAHCRRLGPGMATAVRRYSTLALISIIVMAASGIVNALIRVEPQDWLTSTYGLIIVAKMVGVVVLGVFGYAHRSLAIPQLKRGDAGTFRRVAIVEVAIMAAVTGIAITMGRTPPPPPRDPNLSPMAIKVGFDLYEAPTFWNVWTMWRFDIMFSAIAIVLAALYIYGVVKLRRRGEEWPAIRTFWFLLGCFTLAVMMSSGMGMNMMALFSMHMVVHMGLTMVVPVFLVLGAPLTLIMKVVPPGSPGTPGMHEWVQALCSNRLIAFITHPAVNTIQFVAFFYFLYITPLYPILVQDHGGHVGMNFLFLISGYIYFWDMIGVDPVPNRRSPMVRLMWLVFSMPFHLFFGVYLMQLTDIIAYDFYSQLGHPWNPDLLQDQKVGGGIAWASGSFPLVVVFGVLFYQWRKDDKRQEKEYDAHADAEGDDEMDAYNQWLAQMNQGRGE